jgi:hypothetical protein
MCANAPSVVLTAATSGARGRATGFPVIFLILLLQVPEITRYGTTLLMLMVQ